MKKGNALAFALVLKNPIALPIGGAIVIFSVIAAVVFAGALLLNGQAPNGDVSGSASVSATVEQYRGIVTEEAKKYGIEGQVDIILALMMQETGGTGADPMQSSESLCGSVGCISDPLLSIQQGVKVFADVMQKAGGDMKLVLQSYNFGSGFIDYAKKHNDGHYSKELAIEFSKMMYEKVKHTGHYSCVRPESAATGACYGDIGYVDAVLKYLNPIANGETGPGTGTGEVVPATGQYGVVLGEMLKYQGWKYVFGGSNPKTGFDCSGLMQWGFNKIGTKLPRTANAQYNYSTKISANEVRPGDLVFFTRTYNAGVPITHVGIYVGDNRFYNSHGSGIGYSSLNEKFWKQHFAGFGRVANFN